MQGLVLIDEIDLYLHPLWQSVLISALRRTFPDLQFIATTHSPVVLAGLAPHEVVRLMADESTGDIVQVAHDPDSGELVPVGSIVSQRDMDPRIMTSSDLFRYYFGVPRITPNRFGGELRRFTMLAGDPYRSDEEEAVARKLQTELLAEGLRWLPELSVRRFPSRRPQPSISGPKTERCAISEGSQKNLM